MSFIANSLIKPLAQWYSEINSATLTGAIDVIVVEQEDGSFLSSPFHVRFGKMGVLKAREKIVDIEMNDEPVDIHMKLDDHGTAFFVEDVSDAEEESIPPELATSPMPESMLLKAMAEASGKATRRDSIKNVFDTMDKEPASPNTSSIAIVNDSSKKLADQAKEDAASTPKATDAPAHKTRRRRKRTKAAALSMPSLSGARASLLEQIPDNSSESSSDNCNEGGKNEEPEKIFDLYDSDNDGDLDEDEDGSKEDSGDTPTPTNSVPNASTPIHRQSTASTQDLYRTPVSEQSEPSLLQARLGNEAIDCILNSPEGVEEASEATEVLTELETHVPPSVRRASSASYYSEPEMSPIATPLDSRSGSPILSDTEFERRKERSDSSGEAGAGRWEWGKLPDAPSNDNVKAEKGASKSESEAAGDSPTPQDTRKKAWSFSFWRSSSQPPPSKEETSATKADEPGIYLDDLKDDEEKISLYLGSKRSPRHSPVPGATTSLSVDDDAESGKGSSIPMSPRNRFDSEDDKYSLLPDVTFSMCGGLEGDQPSEISPALFEQFFIAYDDFVTRIRNNQSIVSDPKLVVRIGDRYHTWNSACPIILSAVMYNRSLPADLLEAFKTTAARSAEATSKESSPDAKAVKESSWWASWYRRGGAAASQPVDAEAVAARLQATATASPSISIESEESDLLAGGTEYDTMLDQSGRRKRYKKTLRLSSEAIKKLNLRPGSNEAQFSVTTALQGTSRCKCHIYWWRYTDRIVISDIDGTITKSDVLGHVMPIIGRDWAQSGVASLFSKIVSNGYHIAYLSARAIGQAGITKDYLASIRQGDVNLPDGPLLLNPTSLINAFHREVIEKKPEKFKIACLRDIQKLFPEDKNPFYAGYGNRVNDVFAYRSVGIPISRIFTINPRGELRHELTQTFQTSYICLSSIVDHVFPPVDDDMTADALVAYSSFAFWREPISPLVLPNDKRDAKRDEP